MTTSPQNNENSKDISRKKRLFKLDNRLMTVYELIRDGRVFADIGTDHAYLPCYAVLTGKSPRAFACDVKDGPLLNAAATVKKYKLEDKITFVQTYGLMYMDDLDFEDIVVAGMGGELICDIIRICPYLKDPKYNFVFQPMNSKPELRKFLCENGFRIDADVFCVSQGRFYSVINAVYDGVWRDITPFEALMGVWKKSEPPKFAKEFALRQVHVISKRISGKEKSGVDCADDKQLLEEIRDFIGEKR